MLLTETGADALKQTWMCAWAQILKPIAHADIVVNTPPVWVRAKMAEALFGLKRDFLNGLVIKGKVTAKKADKIVLYKYADIVKAVEGLGNFKKGAK